MKCYRIFVELLSALHRIAEHSFRNAGVDTSLQWRIMYRL